MMIPLGRSISTSPTGLNQPALTLRKRLWRLERGKKDEAAAYSLPRLQAVCLWLMEGRYDEEGGEA